MRSLIPLLLRSCLPSCSGHDLSCYDNGYCYSNMDHDCEPARVHTVHAVHMRQCMHCGGYSRALRSEPDAVFLPSSWCGVMQMTLRTIMAPVAPGAGPPGSTSKHTPSMGVACLAVECSVARETWGSRVTCDSTWGTLLTSTVARRHSFVAL